MVTSAGIARAPFLYTVHAQVCACSQPFRELGRASTLERAVERITGYWNVYLGFFGDQQIWLYFQVIDLRDGRVCWRNGRTTTTTGGHNGNIA